MPNNYFESHLSLIRQLLQTGSLNLDGYTCFYIVHDLNQLDTFVICFDSNCSAVIYAVHCS